MGPFLMPQNLIERVKLQMAKHGLSENCQPDALGMLMDLTEHYMKGFVTKVVAKARIRM